MEQASGNVCMVIFVRAFYYYLFVFDVIAAQAFLSLWLLGSGAQVQ